MDPPSDDQSAQNIFGISNLEGVTAVDQFEPFSSFFDFLNPMDPLISGSEGDLTFDASTIGDSLSTQISTPSTMLTDLSPYPDQMLAGQDGDGMAPFPWPQLPTNVSASGGTTAERTASPEEARSAPEPAAQRDSQIPIVALPPPLPAGHRYPKFIVIHDNDLGRRIRVKTTLEDVNLREIPDSYRQESAVFPRAWKPVNGPM
ncbi:hypothetical protein KEM55_006517, partial [Ascosphaera atra]